MNVAIIGAGYAGMAAGVALTKAGVPVTIYEAGPAPGGRARRVDVRGMRLDNGIHILIGAYRETLELMRTVGSDPCDALLRLPLDWDVHDAFRFAAAPLPAPWHLALGLLRVYGASWRERWAAARFLHAMRRQAYRLERDCTVRELLQQQAQGAAFIRHLWEPLCLAALNTPLERASAQVFLNVLRDGLDAEREASDMLLARKDLSAVFPEPAAKFIEQHGGSVLLRQPVRRIASASGRYRVHTRSAADDYTHVICATSPHHVAALVQDLDGLDAMVKKVQALRYEPIHTVYLQYDDAVRLPKAMLGLSGGIAQWAFDRGAIAGQRGLIAAIISAGGPHTALTLEEIALRVHDDLARALGRLPAPAWWRVIAEKRATFACVKDVQRPQHQTPLTGFHLAGDYTDSDYPGTIEAAVRSGLACARAVIA